MMTEISGVDMFKNIISNLSINVGGGAACGLISRSRILSLELLDSGVDSLDDVMIYGRRMCTRGHV